MVHYCCLDISLKDTTMIDIRKLQCYNSLIVSMWDVINSLIVSMWDVINLSEPYVSLLDVK